MVAAGLFTGRAAESGSAEAEAGDQRSSEKSLIEIQGTVSAVAKLESRLTE